MIRSPCCFLFILPMLTACGKKERQAQSVPISLSPAPMAALPTGLTSVVDDESMLGLWASDCKAVEGRSKQTKLEFRAEFMIYSRTWFSDASCAGIETSFRYIAPFAINEGQLNAKVHEAHIKIVDEGVRAAAERSKSCSFNVWLADTWHDVTGRLCLPIGENGGVWTGWSMPGTVIVSHAYELIDSRLKIVSVIGTDEFHKL